MGVLHQALRDLSAWVEKGVPPAATTAYEVKDGQVVIPPTAAKRNGIQPVVRVLANGAERAEVKVGEAVSLTATVEVPPGTGTVVAAAWDFEGVGDFPVQAELGDTASARVDLQASHVFSKPGTYFTVLRVASQRQGDVETPFARVQNLGRARIVVK